MGNFILQATFERDYQDLLIKVEEYCLRFSDRNNDFSNSTLIKSLYIEFDSGKLRIRKPKSQTEKYVDELKVLTLQYLFGMPMVFEEDKTEDSSVQQLYTQYITDELPDEALNGGMHIVLYMNLHDNNNASNVSRLIKSIPSNLDGSVTVDIVLMPVLFDHDMSQREVSLLKSNLNSLIDIKSSFTEVLGNIFYSESIDERKVAHLIDSQKLVSTFGRLLLAHINGYEYLKNNKSDACPITSFGITSVQINKFEIINNWCRDLLKNLISPFIEKKEEHYMIDYDKIQSVLSKLLDEEKQLVLQISDKENFDNELFKQYKERILEIVLQNNLNPKERKFLLDCCLDMCNRGADSFDSFDLADIPLPDELFTEQLKEFGGDTQYSALRKLIAQIQDLKKAIYDKEQQINVIRGLLDNNYSYDGELKDDGFIIHGHIFKPYSYQEKPLECDYKPQSITTESSADLRRHFSEIKSQGKQSACASFSLVSVFEYFLANEIAPLDLSEAYVYYNAREKSGDTNKDEGTTLQNIIKAMTDNGVCVEELCPYDEEKYSEKPDEEAYQDGHKRKINSAKNVPVKIDVIKSAIIEGYPVVASFRVFDSLAKNVGGFVPLPTEQERACEKKVFHAMVICGYSDKEGYFIVRNSWGTQFGDNGYCYMPYAYVRDSELTTYACAITGIDVNITKHIADRFKYDLKDKDNNIQFAVLNNQLLEEQRLLVLNKEELKKLFEKYIKLLKSIQSGECMDDLRREVDEKIKGKNNIVDALKIELNQYKKSICSQSIRIVWIIMTVLSSCISGLGVFLHYYHGKAWTMPVVGGAFFLLCLILGGLYIIRKANTRKKQDEVKTQIESLNRDISKLESLYQNKSNIQRFVVRVLNGLEGVADNSKKRMKLLVEIEEMLTDVYSRINEELEDKEISSIEYPEIYQSIVEKNKNKWHLLKVLLVDDFDARKIKDVFMSIQREILQLLNNEFNIKIEDCYSLDSDNWRVYRKEITNTPLLSQTNRTGNEPEVSLFFSNLRDSNIPGCFPLYVDNNQYLFILLRHMNVDNILIFNDDV